MSGLTAIPLTVIVSYNNIGAGVIDAGWLDAGMYKPGTPERGQGTGDKPAVTGSPSRFTLVSNTDKWADASTTNNGNNFISVGNTVTWNMTLAATPGFTFEDSPLLDGDFGWAMGAISATGKLNDDKQLEIVAVYPLTVRVDKQEGLRQQLENGGSGVHTTMSGNITVDAGGSITLDGNKTLDIRGNTLEIKVPIVGGANRTLTITGWGTVKVSASDLTGFTGTLEIDGNTTLEIDGVLVSGLKLGGWATVKAMKDLTLNGNIAIDGWDNGSINANFNTVIINGNISVGGNGALWLSVNDITVNGQVSGAGDVIVNGTGDFTITSKVEIDGMLNINIVGKFTNSGTIIALDGFYRTSTVFTNTGIIVSGRSVASSLQFNGNGGIRTTENGRRIENVWMVEPAPASLTETRPTFNVARFTQLDIFKNGTRSVNRWTTDRLGTTLPITGNYSGWGPLYAQWGAGLVILDMGVAETTDNYKAALWAINNGLFYAAPATGGVNFNPTGVLTRKDAAVVLARYSGSSEGDNRTMPSEVPPALAHLGAQHINAMIWANKAGIYGIWNPDGVVTRSQLATMMFRIKKATAPTDLSVLDKFDDADKIGGAADDVPAMVWAINNGIFGGAGSLLRPDAPADRKDFAVVLWRIEGRP